MKSQWKIYQLGDVTEIVNGGTPKSEVSEYWDGDVLWITPKDMGQAKNVFVSTTSRTISKLGLQKSSAKLIPKNSVILSTRAPIGHLIINLQEMATNQGCRGLIPKNNLDTKFLFYFLKSNIKLLNDLGTGTTFKELSKSALEKIKIPVPPIEEQKRIVEILDKAFEGIAQAEANTRRNLINARELFDSYLNQVFTNYAHHYNFISLNNLTELITKGSSPKWQGINYVEHPGVLFVTSENVGVNELIFEKTKYVEEKFNKKDSKSILKKGDVLTNIVGASIGRTAIFTREETANINQAVCLIRCLPDKLFNQYICYLLNSPYFRKILHENEVNTARANLSLTFFRNLEIPVPTLEEQKNIVNRISKTIQKTQKLETIYQRKLEAIAELKQSILEKAFTGQLSQ
ncbi:type-1 restriction enzyme EcoKI specificity protein [Microcystis aeruginosa NIES-4325]|uniref:Type-1 restriction enzyme EcoKI specificity protein n=1 Tax=Microcystis aeruginosa NIES-4325 TaxID=2569534 RepID=A0A5J4F5E2_MICAE|nr:restriction endonuclease subunit S [Microcystis aeruginosa]GEA26526.1 type-1 restriction enzyme EcoKI specificity protein [Microcystis aeruginosa NIES-4325]